MAFSPEEAMALMGSSDYSNSLAKSTTQAPPSHFSRRLSDPDEGKNEKSENDDDVEPDEYTREVSLEKYTTFLALCRNRQFEEAIILSKTILQIDPHDKVMRQYVPVLEEHLRLQEESEEDDEDDEEEDENEEKDVEEEETC